MEVLTYTNHAKPTPNTLHDPILALLNREDKLGHSMTDFSSSLNPHTAPAAEPNVDSPHPSKSAPTLAPALGDPPDDEVEDYTIKCICGYQDDDGRSVYCENCDTWQHTECYYYAGEGIPLPTNEELAKVDHFCADCKPRPLNKHGARERQRSRKDDLDPSERKAKEKAKKSHKKKPKPPETNGILTNGWSHPPESDAFDRTSGSPRDHLPPAKRPKPNHKPSNSVNAPVLSQPTSHPHKRTGSTIHSPTKSPSKYTVNGYAREPYSLGFLRLHENDPGDTSMQTNLLSDINITQDLSLWTNDVEALKEATRSFSHTDVFHRIGQPIGKMQIPELHKEQKQDESVTLEGRHPKWTCLTADTTLQKNMIVGELKGKVGHMKEYIQDPTNRWDYLRHPAPFVFFHPKLPIYIDTRSEGTTCRYLRRSCAPNVIMITFLENDSEYHFCFVAKDEIQAGTELTVGWTLDEHMRKFFNPNHKEVKQEIGGEEEDYIMDWTSKVLPEFGGCACGSHACVWARYDQRSKASKGRNGYGSKQQTHSSNGYATHSRDDSDQEDGRSTSGSKSGSREMTPTGHNVGEYGLGPGMEVSEREKRKIAALERNFEKLENDQHQPAQKKKKRNSGGSNVNTPGAATSVSLQHHAKFQLPAHDREQKQLGHTATSFSQPSTPGLPPRSHYVDSGTSRRKSGSPTSKTYNNVGRPRVATTSGVRKRSSQPNTPLIPSPLYRQNYVSTAMQTEPDEEEDWYKPVTKPSSAKKPFMSLTKRLLLRSQHDRQRLEERRRSLEILNGQQDPSTQAATESYLAGGPQHQEDTEMPDAASIHPSDSRQISPALQLPEQAAGTSTRPDSADGKPPPPLWPSRSMSNSTEQTLLVNGFRSAELSVQLPDKQISLEATSSSPIAQTPTSLVPTSPLTRIANSYPPFLPIPASKAVQPSPNKKKLTLSDYINKRKGSESTSERQPEGSPEMHKGVLRSLTAPNEDKTNEENNTAAVVGSAIVNTPKKEESDPLLSGEVFNPEAATKEAEKAGEEIRDG